MAKARPGTAVAPLKPAATPAVYDQHIESLPEALKKRLQADADTMKSRIAAPGGDKIRLTKKKTFKLPDGQETKPGDRLKGVVVAFASYKAFFDKPYAEGEGGAPACFALGMTKLVELTPSASSPDKQNERCGKPQASGCCPNNEFGSKGKGKACGDHYLLAFVEPGADPKSPLWLLQLPPTSAKFWDAYVAQIQGRKGLGPIAVLTEIYFDEESEYQKVRFEQCEDNVDIAVHAARLDEAEKRLLTEPDVSGYEAPKKKPVRR